MHLATHHDPSKVAKLSCATSSETTKPWSLLSNSDASRSAGRHDAQQQQCSQEITAAHLKERDVPDQTAFLRHNPRAQESFRWRDQGVMASGAGFPPADIPSLGLHIVERADGLPNMAHWHSCAVGAPVTHELITPVVGKLHGRLLQARGCNLLLFDRSPALRMAKTAHGRKSGVRGKGREGSSQERAKEWGCVQASS